MCPEPHHELDGLCHYLKPTHSTEILSTPYNDHLRRRTETRPRVHSFLSPRANHTVQHRPMGGLPERAKHQHFGLCANRRFPSDRSGGWIMKEEKKTSYPVDQNYYCKPKFVAVWAWHHSHRLVLVIFDQMRCDAMRCCMWYALLVARE